jgi:hypothetical protein
VITLDIRLLGRWATARARAVADKMEVASGTSGANLRIHRPL